VNRRAVIRCWFNTCWFKTYGFNTCMRNLDSKCSLVHMGSRCGLGKVCSVASRCCLHRMRTLVNMGSVASICRVDKMRTLINKASVARKWRVDSMCAVDKVCSLASRCRVVCICALCSINGKDSLGSVLGAALQR